MKRLFFALALTLAVQGAAQAAEITVSAAASLANAFGEMKAAFEKANPGISVNCNFAASDPLLRQIAAGAPVDVFATADQATMDKAAAAGLIRPDSRRNFAANTLVLIVPKGAPKPESLADLDNYARIAIGNPDFVPAGRYAKEALQNAGLWNKLESRLIMAANVRQALDYVGRGEADAGLVYGTDARQLADKVDLALTVGNHEPVTYPIAIVVSGADLQAAQKFLDFVLSSKGQAILANYGFGRP